MRINLQDIGEDGHEFAFKMGEEKSIDTKVLSTIDGIKNFKFRIFIQKTGDIYTTQGDYVFERDDNCSLCGVDISAPTKNKFTEYLMNETKADQKGHAPHTGLNTESQQEVTFVTHHEFDLGEFITEIFAVSISLYPKCTDEKSCLERQAENKKYYVENAEKGHPAFSVLSKLKKN